MSLSLCDKAQFFETAFHVFQSLHFYMDAFYRLNLEAVRHRFSYSLAFTQKRNFVTSGVGLLSEYPFKIIYIEGEASDECLGIFASMTRKPIVICAPGQKEKFVSIGCLALSYDELGSREINACIEKLARSNPDMFTLVASDPECVEPLATVAQHSDRFRFGGSRLNPVAVHNLRLTRPNEYLANHIRRTLLPDDAVSHSPDERHQLLLTSVHLVDEQKAVDRLLTARSDGAEGVPKEYVEDLDRVLNDENGTAYDNLLGQLRTSADLPSAGMIFCAPCIHKALPSARFKRRIPDRILRMIFEAKHEDYNSYFTAHRFRNEDEAHLALALAQSQGLELEYLTNMLTLMALTERLPVLRCPQLASSFFGLLRELRRRHEEGNVVAVNRGLSRFGQQLRRALTLEISNYLEQSKPRTIRVVSDLPIEWLELDGVPLMYRCEISRLPITPGNFLLTHYNQCANEIQLDASMARRVLILNCLDKGDDLQPYPKRLHEVLQEQKIDHDYAEVESLSQYWECLDQKSPVILMHFGHGSYDAKEDIGYLHIGRERTKVWDFRGRVVPPIVLLGSCDTAAIAETYNTPANAFVGLGTRAVLGTFLPVRADRTIELYLRIMANLWDALQGEFALETWGQIVWKTLVLNRYLDFLWAFNEDQVKRKKSPAPGETIFEYTYLWKKKLDGGFDRGYKMCPDLLKEAISKFSHSIAAEFELFLRRNVVVPHTMFFTHLGSPDTIRIVREARTTAAVSELESHKYWTARTVEDASKAKSGLTVPAKLEWT